MKDTFSVIELCLILVKHDRFTDYIFKALITCHSERFNECTSEWSNLLAIEEKYNNLLSAVRNNNIRGGEVSISDIFKGNDLFCTYINKYFVGFNPEIKVPLFKTQKRSESKFCILSNSNIFGSVSSSSESPVIFII